MESPQLRKRIECAHECTKRASSKPRHTVSICKIEIELLNQTDELFGTEAVT